MNDIFEIILIIIAIAAFCLILLFGITAFFVLFIIAFISATIVWVYKEITK